MKVSECGLSVTFEYKDAGLAGAVEKEMKAWVVRQAAMDIEAAMGFLRGPPVAPTSYPIDATAAYEVSVYTGG